MLKQKKELSKEASSVKRATIKQVGYLDISDYQWETYTLESCFWMSNKIILDFRPPEKTKRRTDN